LYMGQIANNIMPPATNAKICIHSMVFYPLAKKNPISPSRCEVSIGFVFAFGGSVNQTSHRHRKYPTAATS
jgi:hypothetical protein